MAVYGGEALGALGAEDKVDERITWIGWIAAEYATDPIIGVCTQWRHEMADLHRRMRSHWTEVKRTSLLVLLIRFARVLRELLCLPTSGSPYDPVARVPRPAADQARAVELFVRERHKLCPAIKSC